MSEHTPITGELREAVEWEPTFCGPDRAMVPQPEFDSLCDAIDAVHAGLERENAELRERLAVLDNRSDSMHIGSATITVTPRLDLTGVARELRSIADTLSPCNCSNDCTNSERTGTCTADETEHIDISWQDGRHLTIHVMECSECGHTYEHVNGDYEFCPHCGRRIEVNDG